MHDWHGQMPDRMVKRFGRNPYVKKHLNKPMRMQSQFAPAWCCDCGQLLLPDVWDQPAHWTKTLTRLFKRSKWNYSLGSSFTSNISPLQYGHSSETASLSLLSTINSLIMYTGTSSICLHFVHTKDTSSIGSFNTNGSSKRYTFVFDIHVAFLCFQNGFRILHIIIKESIICMPYFD